MKINETGPSTLNVKRTSGAQEPKTSFGATLAKKTAALDKAQEEEILEAVGTQMSRSVLDMKPAELEKEKDEDTNQGW